MQHRTRDLMMRQRTQLINALRAHLAELGIVAAQGDKGVTELLAIVSDDRDARLPVDARASVIVLAAQLEAVQTLIGSIERRIKTQHRANEASKRLETIPGIGVIGATAIAATVADPTVFRSGRDSRAPVQQRRISSADLSRAGAAIASTQGVTAALSRYISEAPTPPGAFFSESDGKLGIG